ncbi:MAG: lipopolysaccharide biosynthesis protein [Acidobacteriota bacterium]
MNLQRIKELCKDTVVYGLGTLGTKGIGFLLIPLYTRFLTPGDYGVLALVNMWGAAIGVVIGLGQHRAVFRYYFKESQREGGQEEVLSTFLTLALAMSLVVAAIVAFARPLARFTLGNASFATLIILVTGINYLNLFRKAPLVIIRARRWTGRYSMLAMSRTLVTITLIVYFVVARNQRVLGVLTGQAISAVLFTALLSVLFLRHIRPRFSAPMVRKLLAFGLPFVMGDLLLLVFRYSNRYFLSTLASVDQVGQFSLGNRFGEIILLLNTAIQTAWPVFLYGSERDEGAPRLYSRAMTYYLATIGFAGVGIVLFSPEIYRLMVHPRFNPSMSIIPIAVVTYIFMGVNVFGNVGIHLKEKTQYYMVATGTSAAVSVGLNILLIPFYGIRGAAVATLGAYATQAGLTLWISRRLYPISYEIRRIGIIAGVMIGAAALGRVVDWGGPGVTVTAKAALWVVGVPAALFVLRFFTVEERQRAGIMARRLLRGPR